MHSWMRHPKTTQEKKANERDADFVRAKRAYKNLVDTWDDIWTHNRDSWKSRKKKKKQYRIGPRKKIVTSAGDFNQYRNLITRLENAGDYYKVKYSRGQYTVTYWTEGKN